MTPNTSKPSGQVAAITRVSRLMGIEYRPINPPCADNEELAAMGKRLVLYHGRPESALIIAPVNVLQAGWVIGIAV